jgi:uncharacterized protein (DUF362 family)
MAATSTSAMQSIQRRAEEFLLAQRNADGGWGYAPGQATQPEPTALALLALGRRREQHENVLRGGADRLAAMQDSWGAIRVPGGFAKSYWPTAVVVVALHRLRLRLEVVGRSLGWLLAARSKTKDMNEELARDFEIDASLVGWSWTEDTFSWVDPTAWVVLALRQTGNDSHPRTIEGLRLLLDRAYPEGGANCGNRRIYGSVTEPVPANTCSLLLAHAGLTDHAKLQSARAYLRESITAHTDLENLCWTRLALQAWKDEPATAAALPPLVEKIGELFEEQSRPHRIFRHSVLRHAETILALACDEYHPLSPAASANDQAEAPALALGARRQKGRIGLAERISSAFRGLRVAAAGQLRALPNATSVHIARAATYEEDLESVVSRQFEHFRDRLTIKDKQVVIKPNLVEYHPDRVINTNPSVIGAVIALCRKEGAREVIVAEGPGHWRNVEYLVRASGLAAVLERFDVRFVDVNSDQIAVRTNLGMLTGMEEIYFSATVANADVLISMPKLKTHHWAGVTLSLKNLFGTLPGICYGWPKNELHHRGIENSIVDIALTRTPDLAVVDGIIGMEGDGPLNGRAKPLGAIVMGIDPLAVDATCARLMGFRPEKIGHLLTASRRRLGHLAADRISQLGESIEAVRQSFQPAPKHEAMVEEEGKVGS